VTAGVFHLVRHEDVSGVSGTGRVAEGVEFTDGPVVIRWFGDNPSTVIWESLDAAMAVHGHDGRTVVERAAAERERIAQAIEALPERRYGGEWKRAETVKAEAAAIARGAA
jgi:hypothetical protein